MDRPTSAGWRRAFLQPVTYLGVTMLLCIYATLAYLIVEDRRIAVETAISSNENLVTLFEQLILRSFKGVDNRLKLVRTLYQSHRSNFNLSELLDDSDVKNDLTFQYTVVGPTGFIEASTVGGPGVGFYVGDRRPFIVHTNSAADELYVSEPTFLQSSQRKGLVLTRRLTADDGSFQGVIAATIAIDQFEKLYRQINLGDDGLTTLWGSDGIIRVAGANGKLRSDIIGKKFSNAGMFAQLKLAPAGTYWNVPLGSKGGQRLDYVKRLVSYRQVSDFPLITAVGNSEAQIFKNASRNASIYWGISATLTIGILAAIGFGARREWKLDSTASALAMANTRFAAAIANMPHGLSMCDAELRLIVSNQRYATMYGLSPEQTKPGTWLGNIFKARVTGASPEAAKKYVNSLLTVARNRQAAQTVTHLPDGRIVSISHQPMADGGAVAIHQDITAQKQAELQIWNLAHYDGLTGLANRLVFLDELKRISQRCLERGERFAVILLDIDRFKEINDSLGHPIGDALLKMMARRLQSTVGGDILIARLDGDEFAILQPINDEAAAIAQSIRFLGVIEEPFNVEGHQLFVEASIGIALAPEHDLEPDHLMQKADLALYRAKAEGRKGYRVFETRMAEAASSRHTLLVDLRNSIEREEFEIHYQPILDTHTLAVTGMEALVRWRHPKRGMIPPDQFIGLAEDTGLIKPLGDWILRRACYEAASWPEKATVAVNLSPVQFRKNSLVDSVTRALAESGLPPARLELEVTESVLLEHDKENLNTLRQLQHLGIGIVLDDFGTGYSSLSYLRQFPFNKVKIDRTFVADLGRRADCMAIVSAITGLTRHLDITTTAEGVETDEHLTLLRAAGCQQVQGFLFGRPAPQANFDKLAFAPDQSRFEGVTQLRSHIV